MTTVIVDGSRFELSRIELTADAFHHLFRVRRLRVGDRLRVVDGLGRAREGCVDEIERHCARLALGDSIASNEPALWLELLVAAPRPGRAAWLVEKATEVGVAAIRFVGSSRSPRTYGAATIERLTRSARAAVEQCDRSRVPEVTGVHKWQEIAGLVGALEESWVLDTSAPLRSFSVPRSHVSRSLLIGPEGGWEPGELEELSAMGCERVGLGRRILRVETAAVVAAAAFLVTSSVDTV